MQNSIPGMSCFEISITTSTRNGRVVILTLCVASICFSLGSCVGSTGLQVSPIKTRWLMVTNWGTRRSSVPCSLGRRWGTRPLPEGLEDEINREQPRPGSLWGPLLIVGKVAQMTRSTSSQSGSHRVFLTHPEGSSPEVRIGPFVTSQMLGGGAFIMPIKQAFAAPVGGPAAESRCI